MMVWIAAGNCAHDGVRVAVLSSPANAAKKVCISGTAVSPNFVCMKAPTSSGASYLGVVQRGVTLQRQSAGRRRSSVAAQRATASCTDEREEGTHKWRAFGHRLV